MQVTGVACTCQALLRHAQCPLRAQLGHAPQSSSARVLWRGWRTNSAPHPCIRGGTRARQRYSALANVWGPLLFEDSEGAELHARQEPGDLVTFEEAQDIAARRGLALTLKTLGPFYRIVIRDAPGGEPGAILAVSSGFTVPAMGLMHCDSLEIFTRGRKGPDGERVRGGILGLGLLMGGAVFSYGRSCRCHKAEILAIRDDDSWHKRLVQYYSYFGFRRVRAVGDNGLRDLPDRLVWGGVGMRMDADIEELLKRWSSAIRKSASRKPDRF